MLARIQHFPASSTELYPQSPPQSSMSAWMAEMADVVDAAQTGGQAPPVSKAAPQRQPVASFSIDDTPTEPATSPQQLPTREIGPQEEPERYPTRCIVNDGQWTPAKSSVTAWKNGKHRLKAEASRTIQLFHMVHLRRKLHPCELLLRRRPPCKMALC